MALSSKEKQGTKQKTRLFLNILNRIVFLFEVQPMSDEKLQSPPVALDTASKETKRIKNSIVTLQTVHLEAGSRSLDIIRWYF